MEKSFECDDVVSREAVIKTLHDTIFQFFDVCGDDEETPMSDKDKLLLEVNKAICNNIKALEQEPCDDAISRDAAIDVIENWLLCNDCNRAERHIMRAIQSVLYDLPSVTQKSETVTEFADRCRECGARYGKLLKQKSGEWIPFSERLPKPFENCLITTTDGEVIYHYDDGHYSKYKAWMPLPEPYKAESEE